MIIAWAITNTFIVSHLKSNKLQERLILHPWFHTNELIHLLRDRCLSKSGRKKRERITQQRKTRRFSSLHWGQVKWILQIIKKQMRGLKYILKLTSIKTTAYMKIQVNYSLFQLNSKQHSTTVCRWCSKIRRISEVEAVTSRACGTRTCWSTNPALGRRSSVCSEDILSVSPQLSSTASSFNSEKALLAENAQGLSHLFSLGGKREGGCNPTDLGALRTPKNKTY